MSVVVLVLVITVNVVLISDVAPKFKLNVGTFILMPKFRKNRRDSIEPPSQF